MSDRAPNIIFMHSHNTGRYIEPYGHPVPAPALMRLAREGVVFRQAFSAAPTCSPSRGSLMTGTWPHVCGMFGLAHRGFAMNDYRLHLAQYLKRVGYTTALSGVEHTAPDVENVGYDRIISASDTNYAKEPAPEPAEAAVTFLRSSPPEPFFLSVGLNETHRPFPKADPEAYPAEDPRYTSPVRPFPDVAEAREEAADLKAAVRIMDGNYGAILDSIDEAGLRENTYVFCFTDHGLQFPRNMCNLTVHGTGVYLLVRGPEHFSPGTVRDELVSLLDLYPTVCELAELETPAHVAGRSLLPLVDGKIDSIHDHLFSEINYHAAAEPTRAVRDGRYVLIRRYDGREKLVLANVDDTLSKEYLLKQGWEAEPREKTMLYDGVFDPDEVKNIAGREGSQSVLRNLSALLDAWMHQTNDPLLHGGIPAPSGARVNDADDRSPNDSLRIVG